MSYPLFKTLHPPTTIDHCVAARFTSENDLNLVVARECLLEVYRLPTSTTTTSSSVVVPPTTTPPPGNATATLELVGSFPLFGNVESMETVRLGKDKIDSLLVTFAEAKVTICQFDQAKHDLRIVSMHYYEKEELKEGRTRFNSFPLVRVDPQHRCSVILIYDRKLIVLPFKQGDAEFHEEDEAEEETDETEMNLEDDIARRGSKRKRSMSQTSSSSSSTGDKSSAGRNVMPSYIVSLAEEFGGVRHVKDYVFLHGYFEPTLLILHEPKLTWSGRYAVSRDTCQLKAISLNVSQKVHPVIWSAEGLPHDSFALAAVPEPLGGAIVFSANAIHYLNQGTRFVLPLNDFYKSTDHSQRPPHSYTSFFRLFRLLLLLLHLFLLGLRVII